MIILGWIAALGLLAFLFDGWYERQYNPNPDPDTTFVNGRPEVRLQATRLGHYLTTGQINGVEAVFLLDTGATSVAIPGEIAARFGLRRGAAVRMQTANGTSVGFETTLESVRIGTIVRHNVRAIVAPGFAGEQILLGMTFLRHLDIEQSRKQLLLRVR